MFPGLVFLEFSSWRCGGFLLLFGLRSGRGGDELYGWGRGLVYRWRELVHRGSDGRRRYVPWGLPHRHKLAGLRGGKLHSRITLDAVEEKLTL
jgi:hypothetical protein